MDPRDAIDNRITKSMIIKSKLKPIKSAKEILRNLADAHFAQTAPMADSGFVYPKIDRLSNTARRKMFPKLVGRKEKIPIDHKTLDYHEREAERLYNKIKRMKGN